MNKKLLAIAVAGALAAPLSAQALDVTTYGVVGWKLVDADNASWEMKNTKARVGWRASEDTSAGKFIAEIEIDLDSAANGGNTGNGEGDGNVNVRRSRVILATKGAGTFVMAGRTPSGQYADMYSMVDIFEHGGYHYFAQTDHTGKLIAWKSPVTGGFYVVPALIANDPASATDDIDVTGLRFVWNGGPWHAGFGLVEANNSPASDSTRESLGVSWTSGPLMVGFTWEDGFGSGAVDGDTVMGLAAAYTAGNNTFKLGLYNRDSDITPANDGDSATTLELAHAFSKNVTGFVTFDSVEVGGVDADSTAIGINMSF
ncbi:MAG: hypothetical protein DWQ09_04685 [Proteobacteria bacterium]|nr:MAG: hypothetical protein DWQ09_04685 [Pseudomonadota bacterium]QKK11269.1 MAG: hypothetical protein HND59_06340 [Pseudomonadota bacterium]